MGLTHSPHLSEQWKMGGKAGCDLPQKEEATADSAEIGRAPLILPGVLQAVQGCLSQCLPTPCAFQAASSHHSRHFPAPAPQREGSYHHPLLSHSQEEWWKVYCQVLGQLEGFLPALPPECNRCSAGGSRLGFCRH